jgi:PAS domain S-box-containing protein
VLDALPMAVVVVDGAYRIRRWNTAAETLYGRTRTEVMDASMLEVLFDRDDRPAAAARFAVVAGGGRWEGDCRVRGRDGALLVSSFRLVATGESSFAWIATDVTDQGLAEQERMVLLSAEHAARATAEEALGLVEAIVSSAPVAIAVFDTELRYVRVNDAYAELSGVVAADHIGGRLGEVVPVQDEVRADLHRVATTGRTILGRQVSVTGPGATTLRYFTVSYFPVRGASGALVGAGLAAVEISELKRAEAERSALLDRAEKAQRRLSVLATASAVLTSTMDLHELLGRLARVLTPAAADWCIIELFGERGQVEHLAVSHRDRVAADRLEALLRAGPSAAGAETAPAGDPGAAAGDPAAPGGDPTPSLARLVAELGLPGPPRLRSGRPGAGDGGPGGGGSSVVAPIESRGQTLGVLILATDGRPALGGEDLDLALELAHRAALAVGNARAYEQERRVAETLQRALLPTRAPAVAGLDLGVRYVAATDGASVGGDWYDVLPFDHGRTGLVVGDVIGHDISASTAMGQLRSALRAYAYEEHSSPAATLGRLDRVWDSLGLTYATCTFGVFDADASEFRWSNAGHPPPLLVRAGRASLLDEGTGVWLGVTSGAVIGEATVVLEPGDLLVMYTDGLVERRGESLDAGLARLGATAERVVDGTAALGGVEGFCDALLTAMVPATAAREDDVAILVARIPHVRRREGTVRLTLAPDLQAAARARRFTAEALRAAGWQDRIDVATLLVSELVTNAVRHADGQCTLVITSGESSVEVATRPCRASVKRRPSTRAVGDSSWSPPSRPRGASGGADRERRCGSRWTPWRAHPAQASVTGRAERAPIGSDLRPCRRRADRATMGQSPRERGRPWQVTAGS